jgi:hypothetical protein
LNVDINNYDGKTRCEDLSVEQEWKVTALQSREGIVTIHEI